VKTTLPTAHWQHNTKSSNTNSSNRSGQGETVLSILIEFDKFLAYENREENPQNV